MRVTADKPLLHLHAIPAFVDNIIWLLHDGRLAWVVDPGDMTPVQATLHELRLELRGILLTHHHPDHTGGVEGLVQSTGAEVYGPTGEPLPEPVKRVSGGSRVQVLGSEFEVIDVPGHTSGHIAYFCAEVSCGPLLFCGDTLFSGGCGRLFEGTPAQMLASLDRLASLPDATLVCCAHEYTLLNLRFALAIDPHNDALKAYAARCAALRERGALTLPSRMLTERLINPFLRSREPSVRAGLRAHTPVMDDDVAVFAAIRDWKNRFL